MRPSPWLLAAALLLPLVPACGSSDEERPEPAAGATPGSTVSVDLQDRPVALHVPQSYDPDTPAPLVVLLHGYTSSAAEQEEYFQLTAESDRRGFLYALPDGTADQAGDRFWNATDACCDFGGTGVDDAAYLRQLVDTVTSSYPVDPARVYLVGHSNGGFMAHRMACDHADVVTAIVSLAGMAPDHASACEPERPVRVLQIHGTADTVIPFDGGANRGVPFPSVDTTLERWRGHNGCSDDSDTGEPLDLDSRVSGPETTVTSYTAGCRDASRVELWSIEDGRHVPLLTDDFAPAIVEFLYASDG